jgi:hypothetical protein
MKKTSDFKHISTHNTLENLELPEIVLPARQKRLREALLVSAYANKDNPSTSISQKSYKRINLIQPKIWVLAASIALLLFSYGFYTVFLSVPPAVANITLHVNPAIRLSISEENTVVDSAGLDEQGKLLLTELDLRGQEVQEALRIITDTLHKSGLLKPESRILVALTPIDDKIAEHDMELLAQTVRNTLIKHLLEKDLLLDVKVTLLSKELSDVVLSIGLMPVYYVDLVDAVGSEMAAQILSLQKEMNIDPELFKEKLDTITESIVDMLEAGVTAENAIIALKLAINADPELGMLSTIINSLIDLIEEGFSFEEALAKIQSTINADPTLEAFDDLIDPYEDDEQYETEDEEIDEPEEAQDDNEQEDKQTESEQPGDEDKDEADAPKSDDPADTEKTSYDDEAGSDEMQDNDNQDNEDPADTEQSSYDDEAGSYETQGNNNQDTKDPADTEQPSYDDEARSYETQDNDSQKTEDPADTEQPSYDDEAGSYETQDDYNN